MDFDYDLHISGSVKCRPEEQRIAAVKEAAELWRSGNKKEAVHILSEIFNETTPDETWFIPYAKEFGREYRDLISKLYLLHIEKVQVDYNTEALLAFEEACGGDGIISKLASYIIGQKWEDIREAFYDKCPECMFMGDAEEPFSLKLRSENCIECIPEDGSDLHELAEPAERYNEAMDGYSFYEGYALVKDDPAAPTEYPAEIKDILEKIKARKLKNFPNVIFPLTQGKDILDTCRQMQELLLLLDHGYHFESVTRYITDHLELFPDIAARRLNMFTDDETDDDELDDWMDEEEILFDEDDLSELLDEDDATDDAEKSPKST